MGVWVEILETELLCDSALSSWVPQESRPQTASRSVLTGALFTTVKLWNQSDCPSINKDKGKQTQRSFTRPYRRTKSHLFKKTKVDAIRDHPTRQN